VLTLTAIQNEPIYSDTFLYVYICHLCSFLTDHYCDIWDSEVVCVLSEQFD